MTKILAAFKMHSDEVNLVSFIEVIYKFLLIRKIGDTENIGIKNQTSLRKILTVKDVNCEKKVQFRITNITWVVYFVLILTNKTEHDG